MKPDCNRPIAIEDLLRLKRAERPPAEFWTQFDRELRAKQLAALVAKRPWWQTLPRVWPLLPRYRLLLGTSAVLAITFLSVREYQATQSATRGESTASLPAVSPAHVASASDVQAGESDIPIEAGAVAVSVVAKHDVAVPASASLTVESTAPGELSRMVPLGGASGVERESELPSPSARYIASNLAAVQSAEPVATRNLLGVTHGFEARVMPMRVAVEPLQQMTPPSDTRRSSRLLTAMVATAAWDTSARTTERAASRIAEDHLYDQNSRFDARGNGVRMKF